MSEQTNVEVNPSQPTLTLTERQRRVLDLLLEGNPLTKIAAATGVGPTAVADLLQLPHFRAALDAEREARWQCLLCRVQLLAIQALESLAGAIQDKSATVRTRAARLLLDYQLKLRKLQTPSQRNSPETSVRPTTNPISRGVLTPMPGVR